MRPDKSLKEKSADRLISLWTDRAYSSLPSKIADEVIGEAGYTAEQIDWIVPHQANRRIIESTAKHLGLSMDKVILTVQDHGNTSAASIPLALDTGIRSGQIKRGQNLLLEGIGGGFAWGAVLMEY